MLRALRRRGRAAIAEAPAKVAKKVSLPSEYWLTWGVRPSRLRGIVVPICFVLIFVLLVSTLGSARDAPLVFSAVPLALTGGVAAL